MKNVLNPVWRKWIEATGHILFAFFQPEISQCMETNLSLNVKPRDPNIVPVTKLTKLLKQLQLRWLRSAHWGWDAISFTSGRKCKGHEGSIEMSNYEAKSRRCFSHDTARWDVKEIKLVHRELLACLLVAMRIDRDPVWKWHRPNAKPPGVQLFEHLIFKMLFIVC